MKGNFESIVPYEIVIGLEVHAQLKTETKIFCGCRNIFGSEPNTNVCPVCLGYPGALPVLNRNALEYAIMMGLTLGCTINRRSWFARKNYFYPDLPKGYQISQFENPVCEHGEITVYNAERSSRNIRIKRIHLEEDAGKLIHDRGDFSLMDTNRCGSPLIEIVTEPDFRSPDEAADYVNKIRELVRYLDICDGNMEEGSLRCDANVSLRKFGAEELGVKTEIKNMNSLRNLEKALEREIFRQAEILEDGGIIIQQTLLWNADKNEVFPMRSKEDAHDYRYFPDPDLVEIEISDEYILEARKKLPELPEQKRQRLITQYSIPEYDAGVLSQSRELSDYFEHVANLVTDYKLASNWMMGEVLRVLNEEKLSISAFPINYTTLAELLRLIEDETINGKVAKEVFHAVKTTGASPFAYVEKNNLGQISDPRVVQAIIDRILESQPSQVSEYRQGKEKVFGFFVGTIMKETKGRANPVLVNRLLMQSLTKH